MEDNITNLLSLFSYGFIKWINTIIFMIELVQQT